MFIAFLIINIIAMLLGLVMFFLGIALLKADIVKAEKENALLEEQGVNFDETDEVRELTAEELDKQQELQNEIKKLSPLPYMFSIEGGLLFVIGIVLFCLKLFMKAPIEWYIILPSVVGYVLLCFVLNAVLLGFHHSDDLDTYATQAQEGENEHTTTSDAPEKAEGEVNND